MTQDFLLEQIKTIRNLCDVAVFLREEKKMEVTRNSLLATMLELLYQEAQTITLDNCVENESL